MLSSDLTLPLVGAGALVLLVLLAQGVWQAYKASPKKADLPARNRFQEPSLGGTPTGSDPLNSFSEAALHNHNPGQGGADYHAMQAHELGVQPSAARSSQRMDHRVDVIVPMALETALSGEVLLSCLPATRRVGSKSFLVEGLHSELGQWEPIQAGERYSEIQIGLQLANRSGSLNEIEYSEFVQKIESLAQSVGGTPDFPDMLDVVARARTLDAFASEHDMQLTVHLRSRDAAWSVGYLQQHASKLGFVSQLLSGKLVLPSGQEGAPPMLSVGFNPQAALTDDPQQAALRSVTVSFDVAQTSSGLDPFQRWQDVAQSLAHSMDAVIVDDEGRLLSADGFEAIRSQLLWLYQALEKHDLAAGSVAARRLFS